VLAIVDDETGSTRIAIELLTVWLDRSGQPVEAAQYIAGIVRGEDAPEVGHLVVGQLNLAELLLLKLAEALGAEDLRASAHEILQGLSSRLPE
jgi:hypothetical protein